MQMTKNISDDIAKTEQTTQLTEELHGLKCPICENHKTIKYGKVSGNQRYKCTKCGKHFRSTTGKTIHHLHLKPKLQAYIECMTQGLSLRKTAKQIGISLQTAFRWRHRLLSAMPKESSIGGTNHKTISVYVLPFSNKGKQQNENSKKPISNIIQIDVTGQVQINVIGRLGKTVGKIAQSCIASSSCITSKALPQIFKAGLSQTKSERQRSSIKDIRIEITNWLHRFRGVASKYLENYWSWFSIMWKLQMKQNDDREYMYQCF